MANDYKSIYLKELLPIIAEVAVDVMATPEFSGKKQDGTDMTMAELANRNSMIAFHNEGVREMANALRDKLLEVDDDD